MAKLPAIIVIDSATYLLMVTSLDTSILHTSICMVHVTIVSIQIKKRASHRNGYGPNNSYLVAENAGTYLRMTPACIFIEQIGQNAQNHIY